MPGGGKRQATLELIGRHPKPFDTITVMHLDPKGTTEYEILGDGAKMIGEDELPDASTFDRSKRNLLIIDEINISDKKPAYKKKFDRFFNYCSTHCSLSIICQVQDAFTLPVSVQARHEPLGAMEISPTHSLRTRSDVGLASSSLEIFSTI